MKRISAITLALMLLPLAAHAARARKPSSQAEILRLTMVYGERTSEFTVVADGEAYTAWYAADQQPLRSRPLQGKDAEYLVSRVTTLPRATADPQSACPRSWVSARATPPAGTPRELIACLGDPTPTGRGLTQLANLLGTLF